MKRPLRICFLLIAIFLFLVTRAQHMYTIAGAGKSMENLPPLEASVTPGGVAVNGAGNIYLIDLKHHSVRKYDIAANRINTIASGNGPGFSGDSAFTGGTVPNNPNSIALNVEGRILFIRRQGQQPGPYEQSKSDRESLIRVSSSETLDDGKENRIGLGARLDFTLKKSKI